MPAPSLEHSHPGVPQRHSQIFWCREWEPAERELWDAAQVVGHLVAAGSMFGFLAAHRADVFPDEDYADLFSPIGRPSLPATRMAAVLTLQALHSLSDRECAEAVRCDLRWEGRLRVVAA